MSCFEEFCNHLSSVLNYLSGRFSYIILCGDINVDVNVDGMDSRIVKDIFDAFRLCGDVSAPTRYNCRLDGAVTCSTLDYILTNLPVESCIFSTFDGNVADHFVCSLTYKCTAIARSGVVDKKRLFKRHLTVSNLSNLKHQLLRVDWGAVFIGDWDSIDIQFENFLREFMYCQDLCCPLRTSRAGSNGKPWVTGAITCAGTELKNMHFLIRNGFPELRHEYNKKKKCYKMLIDSTKSKFICAKIQKAPNKTKALWQNINEQLGRNSVRKVNDKLKSEGEVVHDLKRRCDMFCEYFSSVVRDKLHAAYGDFDRRATCTAGQPVAASMFYRPVDGGEVLSVINRLKNVYSVGYDDVSVKTVKFTGEAIAEPLAALINHSISIGSFPTTLKTAKVIPVHKKGNPDELENYRPISICSVFSKIFESVMNGRLISFLEKFQILHNSQHGFRRGLSTETAAIDRLQFVYDHLDKGEYVVGVFFDLPRVFDALDPRFIREKLFRVGVRGEILDWILSFLTERKKRVAMSGATSEEASVSLGVAQGSLIGPLIFLIFINDLPEFISDAHVVMYADDTSVAVAARDSETVSLKLKNVVAKFDDWCRCNRIMLNQQKTIYMNFHNRRPIASESLGGCPVSHVTNFLGIALDDRLTFDDQIESVCKSLNRAYFALLKLRPSLDHESLLQAYYALCHSRLAYGCLLWGRATEWGRVFVSQKRIVRLVFGLAGRESCRECFKQHRILTFPSIYILKAALYVKRNIDQLSNYDRPYNVRHGNLPLARHRTTLFQKSPHYDFIKIYNKLPETIIQTSSYNRFKVQVKDLLVRGGYYSQREYLSADL